MEGIEELHAATQARSSQSSDVCHYTLYFPQTPSSSTSSPTSTKLIESLHALSAEILAFVQTLCDDAKVGGGYIWQRESFNLRPTRAATTAAAASTSSTSSSESVANFSLQGSTTVGESVEDEWWIVWLLREISKKWKDAVIEVHDNDGQFLLIEAAEVLPGWLTPDNADNRLWIAEGKIHLISPVLEPGQNRVADGQLSLASALSSMFESKERKSHVANPPIQSQLWTRVDQTLGTIKTEHYHKTIAYLPDEIIRILLADETLISKAVATFYERDAIQLKSCQHMRRFRPTPARYASIRMTRSLYAQLASQRFYAPKPFERAGWFSSNVDDSSSQDSIDNRRKDIGVKIACGFEIMYQEGKPLEPGRPESTRATKVHLHREGSSLPGSDTTSRQPAHPSQNQAYLKFLVALSNNGYFQGEIPGSMLYSRLESQAMQHWQHMQQERPDGLQSMTERLDSLSAASGTLRLSSEELKEDSDDWLYIDEQRLETMLQGKPDGAAEQSDRAIGGIASKDEENVAKQEAARLQEMAGKFTSFLEGEGSLEGAMLADEDFSDGDGEDDDSEGDDVIAGPSMSIEERNKRLQKLVPGLSDEPWGAAAANEARIEAKRQNDASSLPNSASLNKSSTSHISDNATVGPTKADMLAARLSTTEQYDGFSSDEEGDDPNSGPNERSDKPKLLDASSLQELSDEEDAQIEFGENEQDDFLKFAREALGLTEEQYDDILRSREKKGAYVPSTSTAGASDDSLRRKQPAPLSKPPSNVKEAEKSKVPPASAVLPKNSRLDSFEELMSAMDQELAKARSSAASPLKSSAPSRSNTHDMQHDMPFEDLSEDDDDGDVDMSGLDAEIAAVLDRPGNGGTDYGLIKNFLESFASQNGQAGPVSNLFGRLDKDFVIPRDG